MASAFRRKGKKTAWQTWNVCGEVSEPFTNLSQHPTSVINPDLQNPERYVILMYDVYSFAINVYEARLDLFACKQRAYNAIPPTQAYLRARAKCAAYQTGMIWGQATLARLTSAALSSEGGPSLETHG